MNRMTRLLIWLGVVTATIATSALPLRATTFSPTRTLRVKPIVTRGQMRNEADRLAQQGREQEARGQIRAAIASWREAEALYKRVNDMQALGILYNYLGLAYANVGQFDNARSAFVRRLGTAYDNKDLQGQVVALNNLGSVYLQVGNTREAVTYFQDALVVASRVGSLDGGGLSLSNLGLVAAYEGDYEQAAKFYEAALALRIQVDNPAGRVNTFNNLGQVYLALNRPTDTLTMYANALATAREIGDSQNQIRAIDGLVALYAPTGRYARAFELLNERLALAEKDRNLVQQFISLRSLGGLNYQVRQLATARTFYERALVVARTMNDPVAEIEIRKELANLKLELPDVQ